MQPVAGGSDLCPQCETLVAAGAAWCSRCGLPRAAAGVSPVAMPPSRYQLCPQCGTAQMAGLAWCPKCGFTTTYPGTAPMPTAAPGYQACPKCGTLLTPEAAWCSTCGLVRTSMTGTYSGPVGYAAPAQETAGHRFVRYARALRRPLLIAGVFVPGLFSLLIGLGTQSAANDPVGMWKYKPDADATGVWAVAIVALAVTLPCVWLLLRDLLYAKPMKTLAQTCLVACLVVPAVIGPAVRANGAVQASAPYRNRVLQTLEHLAPACKGPTAIAGTHEYAGANHPVEVVYAPSGGGTSGEQAGVLGRAASLAPLPEATDSIQLIACIGARTAVQVGRCSYTNGVSDVLVYIYKRDVDIYLASTGVLLTSTNFSGTEADCPETKMGGVGQDSNLYGGDVDWGDGRIWDFIKAQMTVSV
jgi:Double zinc ribbon